VIRRIFNEPEVRSVFFYFTATRSRDPGAGARHKEKEVATMSLAFLAKKSWHTTNISNQEKVWLKQEEQAREKKKLELLQKQMKEEREIEEMRQASGQARPTVSDPWTA
jgi:uncharacterized protein YifE (UPF0438 family)